MWLSKEIGSEPVVIEGHVLGDDGVHQGIAPQVPEPGARPEDNERPDAKDHQVLPRHCGHEKMWSVFRATWHGVIDFAEFSLREYP